MKKKVIGILIVGILIATILGSIFYFEFLTNPTQPDPLAVDNLKALADGQISFNITVNDYESSNIQGVVVNGERYSWSHGSKENSTILKGETKQWSIDIGTIEEDNEIIDKYIYNAIDIHFGVANRGYGWIFPHQKYYSVGIGALAKDLPNPKKTMIDFLALNGFKGQHELKVHLVPAGGIKRKIVSLYHTIFVFERILDNDGFIFSNVFSKSFMVILRSFRFSLLPEEKSSTTVIATSGYFLFICLINSEPINPAPPVITILL